MRSRWHADTAQACTSPLQLRIYTSRLLGAEASLVLHGGGNTSVKVDEVNLFGDTETVLYIKGSGHDLSSITERGFAPVRLEPLVRMAQLDTLGDAAMVNAMRCAMTDATAPTPSVEAILHAIIPYTYVDHTHADAILTVLDTPYAQRYIQDIFGDTLLVVPYVMPGFALAKHCAQQLAAELKPHHQGLILLNHGIFTWGNDAQTSYERMIQFVDMAEQYVKKQTRYKTAPMDVPVPARLARADLRLAVSQAAGTPMVLVPRNDDYISAFVQRADLASIAQRGCVTPDHIIRTRQLPLVGRDVAAYTQRYQQWFHAHQANAAHELTMLDPAPRIILDAELGMLTVGRRVREAIIAGDVYRLSLIHI
mgnify:FL=1